jgi:hypothetical protein
MRYEEMLKQAEQQRLVIRIAKQQSNAEKRLTAALKQALAAIRNQCRPIRSLAVWQSLAAE